MNNIQMNGLCVSQISFQSKKGITKSAQRLTTSYFRNPCDDVTLNLTKKEADKLQNILDKSLPKPKFFQMRPDGNLNTLTKEEVTKMQEQIQQEIEKAAEQIKNVY